MDPVSLTPNLLESATPSLLSSASAVPPQPAVAVQPQPEADFREFGDPDSTRASIYQRVLAAAQGIEPISNERHTLRLRDVDYQDSDRFSKRDQKAAILGGLSQGRRLRGTWEMLDNATGEVLDQKRSVLMTVPHLTERGTFINNGSEYSLKNQQRLLPGVYTRIRDNGEIESHANIMPGKGVSHRYFLDPEKGVFKIRIGQGTVGLMPLLKTMGVRPEQLKEAWGNELFASNYNADNAAEYTKLRQKFLSKKELEGSEAEQQETLIRKFANMELDPQVTQRTLGRAHQGLTLDAVLDITRKLVAVSRKEAEPDDRDALMFQRFVGPEDLFSERISRDKDGARRNLLWKMSGKGNLKGMPSSALNKQLMAALLTSGLGQAIEEINPAELFDKATAVSRMGEGGIPSANSIPMESRSVQPSMLGYIDPIRTPESGRVGVDTYLARGARKGKDGKLYSQFRDVRTGELSYKSPQDVADMTIAFPDSMDRPGKRVAAMRNGKMTYVPKAEVDLVLPAMEEAFNPLSNMIPMKSQVKGQRLAMATRMTTQALPIAEAEAPLVQSAIPGTEGNQSYEELYSRTMGALRAKQGGVVQSIDDDGIHVQYEDGSQETHELYQNFPFNRKTFVHQTASVKPGDRFQPGQLLAHSNFTDKSGATALGRNARTAYIAWQGKNFEDAVVISEGFARKMSSEHMYQHDLEVDERTKTGKKNFIQLFPGKFDKATLARMDDNGIIKPGERVKYGDPLILGAAQKEAAYNRVHKKGQAGYTDSTVLWQHHDSGVVTDVVMGKSGPTVVVKAASPMQIGDKLSGRYGDKGVIADIIPDAEMPQDSEKQPYEVLLNPLGIITRTNPAQMSELLLGKIAARRGKPIKVQDFDSKKDMASWVLEELTREGLSDLEDIVDPSKDQKIKDIATGSRFFMKLHHTAESKGQSRGGGSYTMEGTPAKGGADGSKRIGMLDTNALLSHGATATLQDVSSIRGQKSDEYWMQFMSGYNPTAPKVPMVYRKFVDQLRAAGVNVVKDGPQTNIMALTDKDVDELSGDRELKSGDGVEWGNSLKEIRGGLFDKALTGGHGGNRWSHIKLHEPMPNPVMEEPIRRLLGLTKKDFNGVISGDKPLAAHGSGPEAIKKALGAINIDSELQKVRTIIASGRKSERDAAVRRLGYLKSAKKLGLKLDDYVLSKVPVLPPMFRPVSMMGKDMPLISDANFLYKELFEANSNLKAVQSELGAEASGPERLAAYNAFKAVTGLGDPIQQKTRDKGVKGLLQSVFGASPKFGTLQRKLISTTVDNVGRAVITPNPDLDMDSVGLPEEKAFKAYDKFIARRLVRQGMSLRAAREAIANKTQLARRILMEEMEDRPVYISRAPVLHKFGIMAMKPRLTKGNTLQVSPLIVKGFGADFDGDAMNYHVPSTEKARQEAIERLLPSRNLFSMSDFKSVMHAPANEYVGGLYVSTDPSQKSERPVRIFQTVSDAKKAYESGSIAVNDRVRILES
jgi:DNA-directed RNA polymerase beta subunit